VSVWLALLLLCPQTGATEAEITGWLGAVDRGVEPGAEEARAQLVVLGENAARRVLDGFPHLPLTARRSRARLLAELPAPTLAAQLLAALTDSDPEVRRFLLTGLANPALAETAEGERVAAFERAALADADHAVRAQARQALVECVLPSAVPVMERLISALPSAEAKEIAAGLAEHPAARERLIGCVERAIGSEGRPAPAVLVALLRGYGRALAEVPGGGEQRAERLPLTRLRLDVDLEVAATTRAALATFVARAAELDESERAERVLAALADEGWPAVECLRHRLELAWFERGDAAHALELAEALERAGRLLPPLAGQAWEIRARLFRGAAEVALGQAARAREQFAELERTLMGLRRDAAERFPALLSTAPAAGGAEDAIDTLQLAALVDLWQALLALQEDPKAVTDELRSAHTRFLEARSIAIRTRANDPGTLESLLERDLSPYTLILFNQRFASARHGAALDSALALAKAWGAVAPLEMVGLAEAGAAERAPGDVFADPDRFARLQDLRTATLDELQRQWDELGARAALSGALEAETFESERRIKLLGGNFRRSIVEEEERLKKNPSLPYRSVFAGLRDFLSPSMHAHTLAGHLRAEDRTAEALAICERALDTLRTAPLGSSTWVELSAARFGILRGSVLMDEGRPKEAETAYLESERRLSAIEDSVQQWIEESNAPEGLRQYHRQIRSLRGDALLSLAVNANVRMGDPARALEYFERAFELNQNPFMRVLRACYRARSGKAAEARTVLASVVPVPALYYNIACTHALMGENDQALDYLERDFQVNCPSPGSRSQKRAWAAKDPDLSSLRAEPRFQRLIGGP
jgi:tetratricopeptide (TPR) repeat protein